MSKRSWRLHKGARTVSVAALMGTTALVSMYAVPSLAQDAMEEIRITGSRIKRTTDFTTPNPTTVVDDQYLQNLGIVNLSDAIKQMPSNLSSFQATSTGNSNFFAGSTIANLRGLNPFFGSRTLTLIDTRRHVPTNQGDGVDLNLIPNILISRMETVTGGASAAYGSGAISGVTNIILNRTLEGAKVEMDYGITDEGDGDEYHFGAAAGTKLFDGRGHFVIGAEYQKMDQVGCYMARDWCAEGRGFYTNPVPLLGGVANQPRYIASSNMREQYTDAGLFFGTGLQVNAAGTGTLPYASGGPAGAAASSFNDVVGGDGRHLYKYGNLRGDSDRYVVNSNFTYDITDSIRLTLEGSYGKVKTTNPTNALEHNDTVLPLDIGLGFPITIISGSIRPDNAYIQGRPDLIAAQAAGTPFGGTAAPFSKDWTSQVDSFSVFDTEVYRGAIGLEGSFGDSSWSWDTYFQYGKTKREQLVNDNRHLNAYNFAIDSVLNGSGTPVCRVSTLSGAALTTYLQGLVPGADAATYANLALIAQGCVPINPFGTGAIPANAKAYSFGYLRENLEYSQSVFAANVSGDLFEGVGAGPFSLAFGGEYRTEKGKNIAAEEQPNHIRTDYLIQYGESFSGDVDVFEGYAELNMPLLEGAPFAEQLLINAAIRQSHYKNTGKAGTTGETRKHDITAWKVSGLWDPVSWLRVRGSQSRDIRAANFRELYYGQILQAGGVFGYANNPSGNTRDPAVFDLRGNVDVRPEKSDTSTVGLVLTPSGAFDGLNFAADFYRIKISDAITQAAANFVLDGCYNLKIQSLCDQISGNTPTADGFGYLDITRIIATSFNFTSYVVKGIDFSLDYRKELDEKSSIFARIIASHMLSQKVRPLGIVNPIQVAGTSGPLPFLSDFQASPDWLLNVSLTYNRGPLSITGQGRYVSASRIGYTGFGPENPNWTGGNVAGSLDVNRVGFYQAYNLYAAYNFENIGNSNVNLQVFGLVNNVFDRDPPFAPVDPAEVFAITMLGVGGTNPLYYDVMGRSFRFGIRANF